MLSLRKAGAGAGGGGGGTALAQPPAGAGGGGGGTARAQPPAALYLHGTDPGGWWWWWWHSTCAQPTTALYLYGTDPGGNVTAVAPEPGPPAKPKNQTTNQQNKQDQTVFGLLIF